MRSVALANIPCVAKKFQLVQTRLRKALFGLMNEELQAHRNISIQRSWDIAPSEINTGVAPEIDTIIKQNGLVDLSSEVRLLASRISKVAGFNARVYKELYAGML